MMDGVDERFRVLIVDDETVNIDVLVGVFGHRYTTLVAKSGEQALKRLESPPLPDLILLDVVMPGMDGYEVCRRIKANPATQGITVIFITGKSDEQHETRGFEVGAVDYITKPMNPAICIARVATHLEMKRRGDILERLACLDGLTGIANRRAFDTFICRAWRQCVRQGAPLALLMLDIDFFNRFNDFYGHGEGDRVLKAVAGVMARAALRPEDQVARYGGGEFACVMPQSDLAGARTVATRIMEGVKALNISHAASEVTDVLTVSIGVASCLPVIDGTVEGLIRDADQALSRAKNRGRCQIVSDKAA